MNFVDYAVKIVKYLEQKDFEGLMTVVVDMEKSFLRVNRFDKVSRLYMEIIHSFEINGNIEMLMIYLIRYIDLYENLNDKRESHHYLSCKAHLEYLLGHYEEAIPIVEETILSARENKHIIAETISLVNMGLLYLLVDNPGSSLAVIKKSKELINQFHLDGMHVEMHFLILSAHYALYKGQSDKAKNIIDDLILRFEISKQSVIRMEIDRLQGWYHCLKGSLEESLIAYRKAISIARNTNRLIELRTCYLEVAEVLFKAEFIEESENYKELYDELDKDIIEKHGQAILNKAKSQFNFSSQIIEDEEATFEREHIDTLTDCFSEYHLIDTVMNSSDWKTCHTIRIELKNGGLAAETVGKVYAEKFVYELSKCIRNDFSEYMIGRVEPFVFAVLGFDWNPEEQNEEISWFKMNMKNREIQLSQEAFHYSLSVTTNELDYRTGLTIEEIRNILH